MIGSGVAGDRTIAEGHNGTGRADTDSTAIVRGVASKGAITDGGGAADIKYAAVIAGVTGESAVADRRDLDGIMFQYAAPTGATAGESATADGDATLGVNAATPSRSGIVGENAVADRDGTPAKNTATGAGGSIVGKNTVGEGGGAVVEKYAASRYGGIVGKSAVADRDGASVVNAATIAGHFAIADGHAGNVHIGIGIDDKDPTGVVAGERKLAGIGAGDLEFAIILNPNFSAGQCDGGGVGQIEHDFIIASTSVGIGHCCPQ